MRALIVGLGSVGMRHSRNLLALGVTDLVGYDPHPERCLRFTDEIDALAVPDLDAALDMHPDLAVIASPNRFHVDQAMRCAEANCHLFVEKPLGASMDGVDALISRVEAGGLFAHMGSNWKFHASFQTMKSVLDEGRLGTITGAQVLWGHWLPAWHPWEDYRQGYSARRDLGGGVALDAHEVDYLTWLLGPVADIKTMSTHTGVIEIETEDVAVSCLRFVSGALATMHLDYIQRQARRSYHISGDAGTLEWDIRKGFVELYSAESDTIKIFDTPLGDVNEMYIEQIRHVLDGVEGKTLPVTPLSGAKRSLELQLEMQAHG
jgi:predicted dehydrogenase